MAFSARILEVRVLENYGDFAGGIGHGKRCGEENERQLKVNERKWTKTLMDAGWTVLPSIILDRQQALGLEPTDVNILLHLAKYWWERIGFLSPARRPLRSAWA